MPRASTRRPARSRPAGGEVYGYENLLIATGGHPRQIDGLLPGERVLYFRTLSDYHRLRAAADAGAARRRSNGLSILPTAFLGSSSTISTQVGTL